MVVGDNESYPQSKPEASYRIYRHYDGNPEGTLRVLGAAISRMERMIDDSRLWKNEQIRQAGAQSMAYAIVNEGVTNNRVLMKIEEGFDHFVDGIDIAQLGDCSDLEWVYVVDCQRKLVNAYTTKPNSGCGSPEEHLKGTLLVGDDTLDGCAVMDYEEPYRESARVALASAIQAIRDKGWKFGEDRDPFAVLAGRPIVTIKTVPTTNSLAYAW
jgi:hypothetical protein